METKDTVGARAQDNFDQARAHERYRTDFSKITLTVLSIFVGMLSLDSGIVNHEVIVWGTILFGLFGSLVNAKHYERNRFHNKYADYLLQIPESDYESLNLGSTFQVFRDLKTGNTDDRWDYYWLKYIRLNWLWTYFPLIIVLFVIGAISLA